MVVFQVKYFEKFRVVTIVNYNFEVHDINSLCDDPLFSQTFDLENNYGLLKNQRKFFFLNFRILNLKLL